MMNATALITQNAELLAALETALRHSREAMPFADRKAFDEGRWGPEWMITARDVIRRTKDARAA